MAIAEHEVVIAGAGPTGLMLAGELALAGVDVVIVEPRANHELVGARALGLQSRTVEVFDQRGIADRFLAEGKVAQVAGFAWFRLDISDFATRHPYGLGLAQTHVERILAAWVGELGVRIDRTREVTAFTQDDAGVDVALSDGTFVRSRYLVGCDGGRSVVRKTAGIDFVGWDASVSNLAAEVRMAQEPREWGLRRDAHGIHSLIKTEDGRAVRVLVTERSVGRAGEPTVSDLSEALIAAYGTDYGVHDPTWISRFTDAARQAASYRKDRIVLAGDAAHVHYPAGGQGLNIGIQDAVNLGWKLAQVVKETAPETLLDTYHAERHPVAAAVLHNSLAQVALLRGDDRTNALRDVFSEILRMEEPRKQLAATMSGLDVHYDLGEGHPLLGRRMPDLDLVARDGLIRVFTLLHAAKPVLLNFGGAPAIDHAIDATYAGAWELPAIGTVTPPSAVLIRPDGHVAWVGDGTKNGLNEAASRWFGPRPLGTPRRA